jgi:hypothetical protein
MINRRFMIVPPALPIVKAMLNGLNDKQNFAHPA